MTTHPTVTFLNALAARLLAISFVRQVYPYPLTSVNQPEDMYPFIDLSLAFTASRYRLAGTVDLLRDLAVRVYAETWEQAVMLGESVVDAVDAEVTIGGACLKCVLLFQDPPRIWAASQTGGSYVQDTVFRVELRRDF